jgi:hypothetical protein
MASTPRICVLVTIRTLRPEADDFWFQIPLEVLTTGHLKKHVLAITGIGGHYHRDVDLWVSGGYVTDDDIPVLSVIQNRDFIELSAKQWTRSRISSQTVPLVCGGDCQPQRFVSYRDSSGGNAVTLMS